MRPASRRVALTLDVDWAPDAVIREVAARLRDAQVKATWFVTHASAAIDELRRDPELFELGIHPNFLPGSSHGATTADVLDFCMNLVPDARSMRTHALMQSTPILCEVMERTPIMRDVSVFWPYQAEVQPTRFHFAGRSLLRIAYCWEDNYEMEQPRPRWTFGDFLGSGQQVAVLDFHPIHVFLNSASVHPYEVLKRQVPRLTEATHDQIAPFVHEGEGSQTAFRHVVEWAARGELESVTVSHIRAAAAEDT